MHFKSIAPWILVNTLLYSVDAQRPRQKDSVINVDVNGLVFAIDLDPTLSSRSSISTTSKRSTRSLASSTPTSTATSITKSSLSDAAAITPSTSVSVETQPVEEKTVMITLTVSTTAALPTTIVQQLEVQAAPVAEIHNSLNRPNLVPDGSAGLPRPASDPSFAATTSNDAAAAGSRVQQGQGDARSTDSSSTVLGASLGVFGVVSLLAFGGFVYGRRNPESLNMLKESLPNWLVKKDSTASQETIPSILRNSSPLTFMTEATQNRDSMESDTLTESSEYILPAKKETINHRESSNSMDVAFFQYSNDHRSSVMSAQTVAPSEASTGTLNRSTLDRSTIDRSPSLPHRLLGLSGSKRLSTARSQSSLSKVLSQSSLQRPMSALSIASVVESEADSVASDDSLSRFL